MAVTIKEVARKAGVSIKTVSRVLNNESGVSTTTREAVLKTIELLGYEPNVSARRLARARASVIGLVLNICGEYQSQIMMKIIEVGERVGYSVQLVHHDPNSLSSRNAISRLIRQKSIDGLIFTPPCDNDVVFMSMCEASKVPLVRLTPGSLALSYPLVTGNDKDGMYQLTKYLIGLGHRQFGFLYGDPTQYASQMRFEGFMAALREHNLSIDPIMIRSGNFRFHESIGEATTLLQLSPCPTAIIASNDESAAGVLYAAHQLNVSVPEQLSVAGIDDFPLAVRVWPALTTVRQPMDKISEAAANLLISLIEGRVPDSTHICIDEELVIRESTGPCPV